MESKLLALSAIKILDEKKAADLSLIQIDEISSLADYFVLATGTPGTHVKALADEVEFRLKNEQGAESTHIVGYRSNSWILLDYGSAVIHVFTKEARQFYDLDRLWQDGAAVDLSEVIKEN